MKNVKYHNFQEDHDGYICGCKYVMDGIIWIIEYIGSIENTFIVMMGYDNE